MNIGNRVQTCFGAGTINGFEHFTDDGMKSFYNEIVEGSCRIRVELDDPFKWMFPKATYGDPSFWPRDLTLIEHLL